MCAQSKDLGGVYLPPAVRSFSTAGPGPHGPARNDPVSIAADPAIGLRWSKSSEQHVQTKPHRGPSTPRHKRCIRRSICDALRYKDEILWDNRTRNSGTEKQVCEKCRLAANDLPLWLPARRNNYARRFRCNYGLLASCNRPNPRRK